MSETETTFAVNPLQPADTCPRSRAPTMLEQNWVHSGLVRCQPLSACEGRPLAVTSYLKTLIGYSQEFETVICRQRIDKGKIRCTKEGIMIKFSPAVWGVASVDFVFVARNIIIVFPLRCFICARKHSQGV